MNKNFTAAIYLIIKPLIALMMRNGVAFGDLITLIKQAYVEEVEHELVATNQKTTTSRIAIITGLTRKDVAAIRKQKTPELEQKASYNRAARVVSAWISDPDFCESLGQGKMLSVKGDNLSFEQLVARHSGDMPYRALLDELLRTQTVEVKDDDRVVLLQSALVASQDEDEKYVMLGEDVAQLISSIKHNITQTDEKPRYQRKVCYDRVPKEHLEEFTELANHENQMLLIKLNTWLAQHDMDKQPSLQSSQPMKVGVGVYYFEEASSVPSGNKQ